MREKFIYLVSFIYFLILLDQSHAQIFAQNFNSSTDITDFYNSPPGTNQFRVINTTGAGASVSSTNNNLSMTKLGSSSNIAYAERNYDFSITPTAMKFQFNFSVNGNSNAVTTALAFLIGGDVSNSSAIPTNSNVYAKLGIGFTSIDGEFQIRDIASMTTGVHTFSGTQTITWFLNNSGFSKNYTSPNSTTETLNNDKADIWVGTTKEFSNIDITTSTQTLSRFKILANGWVDDNTIITFDDFLVNDESALPVELNLFSAFIKNFKVNLTWSTATEINNYGFQIERNSAELDSSRWEIIGFVPGHGNSNSPKEYSFVDESPTNGKIKYRLRQIDFDGTFKFSDTVEIFMEVGHYFLMQNFPNPFNPVTTISYSIPKKSNVKLSVYNMLGQEVETLVNREEGGGVYNVKFDGSNLSSGIYLYKLSAGSFNEVKKLLLVK